MKRKIRTAFIMLVFACAVVGVYYKMNTEVPDDEEVKVPKTMVEKLIAKDLDNDYPATVKTVMKLYSQYSKCFYDGEYTEDELKKLVEQYRKILDDELVANNPFEDHLKGLQQEVSTFNGEEKTIMSCYWPNKSGKETATASPDGVLEDDRNAKEAVTYYSKGNKKYASTVVAFTLKKGTNTVQESKEKFVLRQDTDGKWKILGWRLVK